MINILTGATLCLAFIVAGIGCFILGVLEAIYVVFRTIRYGILRGIAWIITTAKAEQFYVSKMNKLLHNITTDDVRHAKKIHKLMIRSTKEVEP